MSAERITYVDKELGENPRTVRVQQWWFEDANQVKNSINNHADLLDQFFFSDPLDGSIGIGATPTAKLSVENTVPGQKLLELTTFGGATTLQADDNGSVWNSGVSASNTNTKFGFESGLLNTSGTNRTFFGYRAGKQGGGSASTGVGFESMRDSTASLCSALGWGSLTSNEGGFSNGVGYESLRFNTGTSCNGFGLESLRSNTGNNSNGFGNRTLENNEGERNTAVGNDSGREDDSLLGSDNTFLGANSSYGTNVSITNSTAVGANITLSQSNSVVLGDTNVTDIFAGGDGAGLNLKSPNGTNYKITVDNAGNLVVT